MYGVDSGRLLSLEVFAQRWTAWIQSRALVATDEHLWAVARGHIAPELRRRSNLGFIFLRSSVVVQVNWLARVVGHSYVIDGETCIKLAVSRLEQLRLRPQEAELAR